MKEFLHHLGYRTIDDAIEFLMTGLATLPVLLMLTGHVVLGAFVQGIEVIRAFDRARYAIGRVGKASREKRDLEMKAGIVEGYGDGTYRGDRLTTRYEMAEVVAKAMARSDKADASLKALIDKLAVEFASELNTLGVRVAKL